MWMCFKDFVQLLLWKSKLSENYFYNIISNTSFNIATKYPISILIKF